MEDDQYGGMAADLGQYMGRRPMFSPQDLPSTNRGLPQYPYHDMLVFRSEENGGGGPTVAGGDGGTGRWPRQETLTLLEIRSKLDPKFKEANQKGPLWDDVSRIMCEEYGFHRSGKKCREKFENLYKYYKKTKEGKAGRQDGKHYRFFRQLEALYNDQTSNNNNSASVSETHFLSGDFRRICTSSPNNNKNNNNNIQESYYPGPRLSDASLSFSHSCDSDTTSSDRIPGGTDVEINDSSKEEERARRSGKGSNNHWKVKIGDFIDAQMKKLMDNQEAWMEKMMRSIEEKERERMLIEEEWRKQDAARMERDHRFWASERAWIEARDAALMDTLHKMTGGKELIRAATSNYSQPPEELMIAHDIRSLSENQNDDGSETLTAYPLIKGDLVWPECEMARLIQLRSGMDLKFQQSGISEELLWEEIATKMACFGHDRSGEMCREKWGSLNNYLLLKCNKKRKENTSNIGWTTYYQYNHQSLYNNKGAYSDHNSERNHERVDSPSENMNNAAGNNNAISDSCFRYLMGNHVYGRIMD